MTQAVAVVRGTLSATASGTTDFTKAGLGTVTAALIIVCNANSTNNPQDNAVMSVGFWDGTNQRVMACSALDNVDTTDTKRAASVLAGAMAYDAAGTTLYAVTAVTDGIRLTNSQDNTALARYATVIMLAGVSAKAVTIVPNTTQNQTTESASLGFAPKLVFLSTRGSSVLEEGFTSNVAKLSIGFAADDGTHRMAAFTSAHNSPAESAYELYSETRAVGEVEFNGALVWTGEVTTFGSDTFTLTTRDGGASSDQVFALALGGDVSFDVGSLSTPTSTGADAVATDIAADAVLAVLTTAKGTTIENDADANGLMIGAADADGQYSHTTYVEDAADTTNTGSVASAAALINLDTSAAGARADLIDATVALNQSDFTLTYTAVDASARKGFWIAFGETPVVAPTTPSQAPGVGAPKARFLRRAHKLPWEQDFSGETEQITVAPVRRKRIALPPAKVRAAIAPIPIETVKEIAAPRIKIPDIGTANVDLDEDDDFLWLI